MDNKLKETSLPSPMDASGKTAEISQCSTYTDNSTNDNVTKSSVVIAPTIIKANSLYDEIIPTNDDGTICIRNFEETPKSQITQLSLLTTPVMGKDRAKKFLKALGSQNKYVREHQQQQLIPCFKENVKKKEKKVIMTPSKKAQETIDEIEALKKSSERTVPMIYFSEHMIHHISPDLVEKTHLPSHSAAQTVSDIMFNCIDRKRAQNTPMQAISPKESFKNIKVASLEAIKGYNSIETEKADDEEGADVIIQTKKRSPMASIALDIIKINKVSEHVTINKDNDKSEEMTPKDSGLVRLKRTINKKSKSNKGKKKRKLSKDRHDKKRKKHRKDAKKLHSLFSSQERSKSTTNKITSTKLTE